MTLRYIGASTGSTVQTSEIEDNAVTQDKLEQNMDYKQGNFSVNTDAIKVSSSSKLLTVGATEGTTEATLAVKSRSIGGKDIAIQIEEVSGAETWRLGVNSSGDLLFFDSTDTDETLKIVDGATALKLEVTDNGGLGMTETGTPAAPTQDTQAKIYIKANKLIIAWNDGGTTRYKYLDLTGTGVTWVHTTTAP